MITPVDAFAPKAKASKVTLKRDNPFKPDLEKPIRKDATNAKIQLERGIFANSVVFIKRMLVQK